MGKTENLTPFRKGQGGRPKGSKNKVPRDIKKLAQQIASEHGGEVAQAWLRGLKAKPPYSSKYLELLLERNLGKVPLPIEAKVSQPIQFFLEPGRVLEAPEA